MKNLIWYLIAGTKGGITRARILELLQKNPANAHQISQKLVLDYKTVRHHLSILDKNKFIYAIEKNKYGTVYFLSEQMQSNINIFNSILDKIGNNFGKS